MLLRPYEYDSIVQNPISEADFKWILHRNCEGTEQLRIKKAGDRECYVVSKIVRRNKFPIKIVTAK